MPVNIRPELIDELLKDGATPELLFGNDGLLQQLTKAILERALQGELTHHLGYEKHSPAGRNSGNSRNGSYPKTLRGKRGRFEIEVPRDREGQFEPQLIKKGQTRFDGFDEQILSLYSRGLSRAEIQAHLKEIYGVEVSPDLITTVTDGILEEVKAWRARPLEAVYPILWLDALFVKIRENGRVQNRAIYLALAVNLRGQKEVLGLWSSPTEGAKFWLQIFTELQQRGVQDFFIACVDGLKGLPEAIEQVFPRTLVQSCLVHLVRQALSFVSFKDRKAVATDLKLIYQAPTEEEAVRQLEQFAGKWDGRYPTISKSWRANWARISPMFGLPAEIRKAIYTTNAIESLNFSLRKIIKTRGSFPNEEAAFKLLYLGLKNIEQKWTMPIANWRQALNQFAILYEDRLPLTTLNV